MISDPYTIYVHTSDAHILRWQFVHRNSWKERCRIVRGLIWLKNRADLAVVEEIGSAGYRVYVPYTVDDLDLVFGIYLKNDDVQAPN